MTRFPLAARLAALALMGASLPLIPALAHHSYSMFDMTKTVTLKGTVAQFKWQNPHAWIQLDVGLKGGGSERWAIEMTSPNNLILAGWKRTSLKPGDVVTIHVNPLRSGAKAGNYVGVILADGSTLGRMP